VLIQSTGDTGVCKVSDIFHGPWSRGTQNAGSASALGVIAEGRGATSESHQHAEVEAAAFTS
jgi:hypothetical protein